LFASTRYSRWAAFFDVIKAFYEALHESTTPGIKLIRLHYLDRFTATERDADPFEVINKNSSLMNAVTLSSKSAFHLHCGWFEYLACELRRLTNVNISVDEMQSDGVRQAVIVTMLQDEALEGRVGDVLTRIGVLHGDLNRLFGDLITKDAADRVSLNSVQSS